jgi:hypothetical protein
VWSAGACQRGTATITGVSFFDYRASRPDRLQERFPPPPESGTTEDAVLALWWSLARIPIGTVLVVVAATSLPARLATRIRTADAL